MTLVVILIVIGALLLARAISRSNDRKALERRRGVELESVLRVADEDVTRFGEELQRLDTDLLAEPLDEAARQDYRRPSDSSKPRKAPPSRCPKPEASRTWP